MATTDSTSSTAAQTPPVPIILDYEPISFFQLGLRTARRLPHYAKSYLSSFFPIVFWIHRYNLTWLISDIIAGVTVGIVVVPQGMGYAKIANLPPVTMTNQHSKIHPILTFNRNTVFIRPLWACVSIVSLVHPKISVSDPLR